MTSTIIFLIGNVCSQILRMNYVQDKIGHLNISDIKLVIPSTCSSFNGCILSMVTQDNFNENL